MIMIQLGEVKNGPLPIPLSDEYATKEEDSFNSGLMAIGKKWPTTLQDLRFQSVSEIIDEQRKRVVEMVFI